MMGPTFEDVVPLVLLGALALHAIVFGILVADLKGRRTPPGPPWKYWLGSTAGDAAVAAVVAGYLGVHPAKPALIGAAVGAVLGAGLASMVARERAVRTRAREAQRG